MSLRHFSSCALVLMVVLKLTVLDNLSWLLVLAPLWIGCLVLAGLAFWLWLGGGK